MSTTRNLAAILAACSLCLAGTLTPERAMGGLLALDDFLINPPNTTEYTGVTSPSTGSPSSAWLAGQNGGTGFTGNWVTGGNQNVVDSDTTMSITGLESPGGSTFATFTSQLNSTRSFNGGVQAATDTADALWFRSFITNDNASGTNGLTLVSDGGGTVRTWQRLGSFLVSIGSDQNIALGTFTAGTTYLLVGRIDIDRAASADDTLSFWALTDLAAFDPNNPLATFSDDIFTAADPGLSGIELQKNDAGGRYDGIYLGTSFQAIFAIVPEPATFALVSLGLLPLGMIRRRRRRA